MATMFDTALRPVILAASRSARVKAGLTKSALTRNVVRRFVAGESRDEVLTAVDTLVGNGLSISVDYLGEDTTDEAQATETTRQYLSLLEAYGQRNGGDRLEVSLKLSALGQALPQNGEKIATENARAICAAAEKIGAWVTVDAEDHRTTDSTLSIVRELRTEYPWLGTVLQAYLRRTEADCREFAGPGSRIRLCKGAYAEPADVAFTKREEVDASYIRCMRVLMAGQGYPMIASHDPAMITMAGQLAQAFGKGADEFEYQMLFGIRSAEQQRLADEGNRVRVYVPFGNEWYGYFVRRLGERPANLVFFLRSFVQR